MTMQVLVTKKIESKGKTKYDTLYSHSKVETIISKSNIDDNVFKSVISNIHYVLWKFSRWIIDSIVEHNINISKNNPLAGSSYIKLPKKIGHPRKFLINIQNMHDDECLKWCIVKY